MTQELAKTPKELREWLSSESFKRQLADALPKTMAPERFVRIALTTIQHNPKLLKCTPESFLTSILQLAAMGIEPDGRRAHLIPYGNQCTVIVDYKGIAELLRRNKDVVSIHCDVVGANDHFEIRFGSRGILDHVPAWRDRGAPVCAYSWVKLPDGTEEYDIMGFEEIEAIRKRSKTPNEGPWKTDWNEMAKKTIFRRHSKTLPLSPLTRDALERDTDGDALTENERFANATPVNAHVAEAPRRPRGRPPKFGLSDEEPPDNASQGSPEPPTDYGPSTEEAAAEPGPQPVGVEGKLPLDEQVRALILKAGYTEAEMLAIMKPARMSPPSATSLSQCSAHHLQMVIEQWDTALMRLKDLRAKAQKQS